MRFVAGVNRRCFAVSRDCADVARFSRTPDRHFRDEDKLPRTMVAFVPLAQSTLSNRERGVVVGVCQLLPPVRLSLSTRRQRTFACMITRGHGVSLYRQNRIKSCENLYIYNFFFYILTDL